MFKAERDPRKRFAFVYDRSERKNICESDDQMDKKQIPRVTHGGCGRYQPTSIRHQHLQLTGYHGQLDKIDDHQTFSDIEAAIQQAYNDVNVVIEQ